MPVHALQGETVALWRMHAAALRSGAEEGNILCQAGQRGATCPPGRWNMLPTVMTMGEKGRPVTDIWGKPSTVSIDRIATKNKFFCPFSGDQYPIQHFWSIASTTDF